MTDLEFNKLMHRFREAGTALAREQQAAGQPRELLSVAAAGDLRPRWLMPALAAAALVATGVSWSAWEYKHPAHRGEGIVHNAPAVAPASATLSDEALLSAVQNDLSDRLPQALQPLAVSYTSNTHARSGQEETKE